MQTIGVRELRLRASEVLRQLRDEGAAFEVTYRGRVIARLVPVTSTPADRNIDEFWQSWDRLAREIAEAWPPGVSAIDAVREDRREL